jgi:hypothetical protein
MTFKLIIGIISAIAVGSLQSCENVGKEPHYLGKEHAKKTVANALTDTTAGVRRSGRPLIETETAAINFAEVLTFSIYGKARIRSQRPYETYLIDGYWIVTGTLPRNADGGTFQIIFSAKDGRVVRITHSR